MPRPVHGAPAFVALDVQALQPGSGASAEEAAAVAGWAGALARSGRLVAALIAPELSAPDPSSLPVGLTSDLVEWDGARTARRLAAAHPGLAHLVPAVWLHLRPARSGLVATRHWPAAGVAEVAVVTGPPPPGATRVAVEGRYRWLATVDLVISFGPPDERTGRAQMAGDLPFSEAGWDEAVSRIGPQLDGLVVEVSRPPDPPRTLLVGPVPPAGGGIGAHNAQLIDASTRAGVRVDLVASAGRPVPGAVRIRPDSVGTDVRPAGYDAVVYTIGNSDGHLPTIELALRHPGWLWLHEGRLPAVFTSAYAGRPEADYRARMGRLLEAAYPGRAPMGALRRAGRDHVVLAEGGVGLVALLARRCRGILVNSPAAERVVRSDFPPGAWVPPILVVPLLCPPVRSGAGTTTRPGGRQIVSFGVVSAGKRPDVLVDAAALGDFDLAFVGPCPPVLRQLIEERSEARGCADRVVVTGEVSDDEWWSWLERADVAVQLRDSTTGESSAAINDALAAGAVVVTNLPSAADLPPGVVDWLPDASAQTVAQAVNELLDDPERRQALASAAVAYAAAHQMDAQAARLWDLILRTDHFGLPDRVHE